MSAGGVLFAGLVAFGSFACLRLREWRGDEFAVVTI